MGKPPPSFGQCPKENVFFLLMSSLSRTEKYSDPTNCPDSPMFRLLGYPESSLVKSIQFKCKLSNVYLYLHSVYFVLCIIESEIRRVSRWETEAVEAAAAHNVATPHILTTSPPCS